MAGGTRTSTATFCFYARHISVPRRFHDRHTGLNFDGMLGAIELDESNLGHLFCTHHTYSHYRGKTRSEEHTSELQSLMRISYAVICLQNKNTNRTIIEYTHEK